VMQSLVPTTPTTETNFATVHQCEFWDAASGRTLPPAANQSASNN
jgi:para-nitrobenzyl esterase